MDAQLQLLDRLQRDDGDEQPEARERQPQLQYCVVCECEGQCRQLAGRSCRTPTTAAVVLLCSCGSWKSFCGAVLL